MIGTMRAFPAFCFSKAFLNSFSLSATAEMTIEGLRDIAAVRDFLVNA